MYQQLNDKAKKVFIKIYDTLKNDQYLKLNNDSTFMPLTVERIGNEETAFGSAELVSLCHYFEQNGDLCQDPEVGYLVVDNRAIYNQLKKENEQDKEYLKQLKETDYFVVMPVFFQQAMPATYTVCMKFENGKTFVSKKNLQSVTSFSNIWMKNIEWQQNL